MPRAVWVLALVLTGGAVPAVAQPIPPQGPLEPLPPGAPPGSPGLPFDPGSGPTQLDTTPIRPQTSPQRPPPVLGAPVAPANTAEPPPPPVAPVAYTAPTARSKPQRAAGFGAPAPLDEFGRPPVAQPAAPAAPVPETVVDTAIARTSYNPPPVDRVNELIANRSELGAEKAKAKPAGSSTGFPKIELGKSGKFGEHFGEGLLGHREEWFRSDHMFDGFISPISNPFLAEDPRSLTEVRPIFIYQKVPSKQPDFQGGSLGYFGVQGRLAITDRWSLVLNKLGGISVNPSGNSPFGDETGFAELWIGPKFTFYRGEETGSLWAAGLQFQIPVGSRSVFQDTGSLSLVPWVSYGQNFLPDFRLGSFNSIISTGYSFSVDNKRSDYYWLSAHLDFDVGNLHRFYPVAELNWFLYTTNAKSLNIGSEGRDLINFGGRARGSGLLTGALGGRFKITESAQVGAAFEIPLAGRKDLFRYRFTLDFILRY